LITNWFPWKYIIRLIARRHGFIDPIAFLAKLRQFAQPSEVSEPIELLRAGALFHARGLINARTIQQNLDWIWPYWVNKQFDPQSKSFQPRAFSFSHVNLTHRNWTAVGLPGSDVYPIVDPRGLVTPFWDGWSVAAWIVSENGNALIPAQLPDITQKLSFDGGLSVKTTSKSNGLAIDEAVSLEIHDNQPTCSIQVTGESRGPAWLVVALRPYNPEGVSFIEELILQNDNQTVRVNSTADVRYDTPIDRHLLSNYQDGDVYQSLHNRKPASCISCDVGMATSAALFKLRPGKARQVNVSVNLSADPEVDKTAVKAYQTWEGSLLESAKLQVPDDRIQFLYDAAVRTVIMLSPDKAYPGPYTYKRFWYRDAVFMVNALLSINAIDRAKQILDHFPDDQNFWGYFHSQEGEWDSNGEALWAYAKYCRVTGEAPSDDWIKSMEKGGKWIGKKRTSKSLDKLHAGLLPSGFSAEHFGNIDHYYWDNYWSVAGLRGAAEILEKYGHEETAADFRQEAADFTETIQRSLEQSEHIRKHPGIPASPYRRMDAGAIGSVVAGYPLQLLPPDDQQLLETVNYLTDNCYHHGAFFQDMVHSGMNAYLTLHVAQVLLRANDLRYQEMIKSVAELASPTGQWPEAIHPHTFGGCMGDGQHGWAAAEWLVMIRNLFVQEEENVLILGDGIFHEWIEDGAPLSFGPTPTSYGDVSVNIITRKDTVAVSWEATWRNKPATLRVSVPNYRVETISNPTETGTVEVQPVPK